MEELRDKEIEIYRDLMRPPDGFVEGFSSRVLLGTLFVGFVMLPGAIYLGLLVGQNLGPAAEWTTIILFAEAARRSFTALGKQEIYLIFYIAGSLTALNGALALSGGPFSGPIWSVYFKTSPAAAAFAADIPGWVVPTQESGALNVRSFMQHAWLVPIVVMILGQVLSRLNWFSAAYVLFRVTSDLERLPFPMAPVAAQGATALAETHSKSETWRWRVFSIGSMIGLAFGAIYAGIPALTGAVLKRPINILPIPWVDFTTGTENLLPAVPMGLDTNLGTIMVGFVLPFWLVVGGAAAALVTIIVNPVLYHRGVLTQWQKGMGVIDTMTANQFDFWMSFGIGSAFAIAAIGIVSLVYAWGRRSRLKDRGMSFGAVPPDRGDFNMPLMLAVFVVSSLGYVVLCKYLVPDFPMWYFLVFAFFFTPLTSYINSRMMGLTGQWVGIPMIREATILLSGYKGADIWFAPLPLQNYGGFVQRFRELELVGVSFRGLLKAEVAMFPVLMVASFVFWQFIWRLAPIPSAQFQYANEWWPYHARMQAFWVKGATTDPDLLGRFLKPPIIGAGFGLVLLLYYVMSWFRLPVMLIYGLIRGFGNPAHVVIPELGGALLGRFYFAPRFGERQWRQFAPVVLAGYQCGMGLISMVCIAIVLIVKSISQLPY
ncbi:MAG: peptide transporter [Armatimonadota bacterium]|nr:peptide transporter [Acidobacteriota bacterium]